ncbi:MAG: hypothetical protein R3F21_21305 [Myxococcota bacterium]
MVESDSAPGLTCPVLNWTAAADQVSGITSTTVDAAGSASASGPPPGCAQGSTTLATSTALHRFVTDVSHEFVLTGTSQNTQIRLAAFSGSIGTIYFERMAADPGGPISFSITLPPGGYSFLVTATVEHGDPVPTADFDVELDVLPVATPVPGLGVGAAALLGVALATLGALAHGASTPWYRT